jgi:hypothetical protein
MMEIGGMSVGDGNAKESSMYVKKKDLESF